MHLACNVRSSQSIALRSCLETPPCPKNAPRLSRCVLKDLESSQVCRNLQLIFRLFEVLHYYYHSISDIILLVLVSVFVSCVSQWSCTSASLRAAKRLARESDLGGIRIKLEYILAIFLWLFAVRKRITADNRSQFLKECSWPLVHLHCGLMARGRAYARLSLDDQVRQEYL